MKKRSKNQKSNIMMRKLLKKRRMNNNKMKTNLRMKFSKKLKCR
jgi:hypothetical protein